MREIQLSRGYVALISAEDYERVSQFHWSAAVRQHTVYASRAVRRSDGTWTNQLLHRFLLGLTDPKIVADHINRDGLDNRRCNLRIASQSQNCANSHKHHNARSSQYRGVSWCSRTRKWQAAIRIDSKQTHLGRFADETAAALAYDAAARKHFGEFANCNFPPKKEAQTELFAERTGTEK